MQSLPYRSIPPIQETEPTEEAEEKLTAEPETELTGKAETELAAEPETEPQAESAAEPETKLGTEPKQELTEESEAEPASEPETVTEPTAKAMTEPAVEPETNLETESEKEPASELKPDKEPDSEIQTLSETILREDGKPEDAKPLAELQTESHLEQTENVQNTGIGTKADPEAGLQEGSNPPMKSKREEEGSIRTRSPDYFQNVESSSPAWCVIQGN